MKKSFAETKKVSRNAAGGRFQARVNAEDETKDNSWKGSANNE